MGMIFGHIPAWVEAFSGYGSGGYGYGGDGYGYGGDGYGGGYGCDGYGGDGYGEGSGGYGGDGYGFGYGGDGSGGYGYGGGGGGVRGDGYGGGYGSGGGGGGGGGGSGCGYNSGPYWIAVAANAIKKWSKRQRDRFAELCGLAAFIGFWRSAKDGTAANGGALLSAAHPGIVQTCNGPLKLCTAHALHAALKPEKWKGERLWIVALLGKVEIQDAKAGALEREIIGEVL